MEADTQPHPAHEQAGHDLGIGDQLREIRKRRGLSQKVISERSGMTQPALSYIEGGWRHPGYCDTAAPRCGNGNPVPRRTRMS
ncbi:helix-turn-helix domain-containing protein [Nonomuraea sp. PA05]|uniref:helix-turn-helix domain-containing protein n=1 Tax=Nonomuraea sp. PA05 TaxID=2604466 RepID=UPI0021CD10E8|nr:helix-turn-helix transcriptional regulator [Nonomuraea sp. PA05]